MVYTPGTYVEGQTVIHKSDMDRIEGKLAELDGSPTLLSGTTVPLSGSGLLPLDGVNNPWRWWPAGGGWVGPAYSVTWKTGDVIPSLAGHLPAGAEELDLCIYAGTTPAQRSTAAGQFTDSAGTTGTAGSLRTTIFNTTPLTAVSDGAGIAYLIQSETGFAGPTAVPDPALSIAALLGSDVVLGAPFTFDESGDGKDGDFWLNTATSDLYGPKTAGTWPAPINIKAWNTAAVHTLTGGLILGADDPANPPLLINAAGEPDAAGYMGAGQLAVWFEPTAAAPVVHFKALDSAGAVYVASLPMTPA